MELSTLVFGHHKIICVIIEPSIYDYLIFKKDFSNGLNSSNMAIKKSNYYHFLLFFNSSLLHLFFFFVILPSLGNFFTTFFAFKVNSGMLWKMMLREQHSGGHRQRRHDDENVVSRSLYIILEALKFC